MASTTYDVLIIGGGPAGTSAALTLVRQRHTVLLFDTCKYRCSPSYYLHGLSGSDHQIPAELIEKAHKECEKYKDLNLKEAEIVEIKKIDDENVFEAKDKDGNVYRGRKVVLANGVSSVFPQVEGYELLGQRNVSYPSQTLVCELTNRWTASITSSLKAIMPTLSATMRVCSPSTGSLCPSSRNISLISPTNSSSL